jgi:hypothetical protein
VSYTVASGAIGLAIRAPSLAGPPAAAAAR